MNVSKFSDLIRRFRDNELLGGEQAAVEAWYDSLESDQAEDPWSMDEKNQLKARLMTRIAPNAAGGAIGLWLGVAASIVLVSLFFVGRDWVFSEPHSLEVIAGATAREVKLDDGSRVLLEAGSTLRYPEKFAQDERVVTLTGDAFFDVSKDAARPFIIDCGDLRTRVLGTSFSIRSRPSGDIKVTVVTGKVALSSSGNEVILGPHERGIFSGKQKTIRKSVVAITSMDSLVSARGYILNFRNVKLSDVLHDLEAKHDVSFILDTPALANCKFTGDLTDQPLDFSLRMASQSLGFTYTRQGRIIQLKGKGCHQ